MIEESILIHSPRVDYDAVPIEILNAYLQTARKADTPYLHWEKLRYKSWVPSRKEDFWTAVKLNRRFSSEMTPLIDQNGRSFTMNTKQYSEILHAIDLEMAGNFMGLKDVSESDRQQFVARGRIEEAIASSQLEGANTARSAAKRMLLEGRSPQTHGERMIVNNHLALLRIEEEWKDEPLSWDLLMEMHRVIARDTLAEKFHGQLRETLDDKGNSLVVKPFDDHRVAYVVPSREHVEEQLPRLIEYANDRLESTFVHPVIKGLLLHFWIGLLHPFEDGNGRLARCLFYWYVLKKDYWAFSYLSLTERILKSRNQYAWAYIYSEQDDNDVTYFIDYNMRQIKLAREHFRHFLRNKIDENRTMVSCVQRDLDLNERQIKLLQYLVRHEQSRTNLKAHCNVNFITKATAAKDLAELVSMEFLTRKKQGREVFYYPTEKIKTVFTYK